jgi:hypothetical protein
MDVMMVTIANAILRADIADGNILDIVEKFLGSGVGETNRPESCYILF